MDLNTLWFVLIAILYVGFFFLEGFDFGVCMLLPFLGRKDVERRTIIRSIAPHWDANEVWLLTAGGATFAAFPHWYATLFSGFYPALFLLLLALILRGVALEFRSKNENPTWRSIWDWCIFLGGFLPAFLLGVVFADMAKGVPIDSGMNYSGGFWNLLNPYALLGGLTMVVLMLTHGAAFLGLKMERDLLERAHVFMKRSWWLSLVLETAFLLATYFYTDLAEREILFILPSLAAASVILTGVSIRKKNRGWAFILSGSSIILTVAVIFSILFPRVMISSIDPSFSLTIYSASSTPYTLRIMTIVAAIFVPLVVAYQVWTYHVFRKRVTARNNEADY